ncbi:hypothetical protein ABWL39_00995 [Chitinivorax sp. PXF-14]|uniref:hypothetical protein n=1 Tax=Chitinivorax sp. PXF-14 TaxID=3230488 RepID=UPI00346664C1
MAHEQDARMRRILGTDLVRAARREGWHMPCPPTPATRQVASPEALRQPDSKAGGTR